MPAQALRQNGYENAINTSEWRKQPAIIQSFEQVNLQALAEETSIPLMQLLDEADYDVPYTDIIYADLMTDSGLADIASYAEIIGPWKESFAPSDGSGKRNASPHFHQLRSAEWLQELQCLPASTQLRPSWMLQIYLGQEHNHMPQLACSYSKLTARLIHCIGSTNLTASASFWQQLLPALHLLHLPSAAPVIA